MNITKLSDHSIHAWIQENKIKNEKGEEIDFVHHLFLFDIYSDPAQNLVVKKAAQVGMSTCEVLKNHYDAKSKKMDIIYTLPTDSDVNIFVGGKVNRIIANNPCMMADTKDKDSIEQKAIGKNSMIYFRGTWSKKAAIMITADRLVHDEKDSSKQDVISDYQARLQHSKIKQTHVFSHPSVPGNGVDVEWEKSDKKEWFITCPSCEKEQILTWNTEDETKMSISLERECYVCKRCGATLPDTARRRGRWRAKKLKEGEPEPEFSGYHVSLLMCDWVSARDVIKKYQECVTGKQTMDFFYNKVLGEPYAGGGNTVSEETIMQNVTSERNEYKSRMVIGVDTGIALRYVIGNLQGLVGYGEMKAYVADEKLGIKIEDSLEYFLTKFPNSIMVIDQGGDIIGSRQLREKYPGRVFLCHYAVDRKTMQLIRWGEKDESGNVVVDRNRTLQLTIDELADKRLPLYNGTKADWHDYYLHWSHIYRVWEEDSLGVPRYKWLRNDRDDWCHATVYFRVGISRFGKSGSIVGVSPISEPNSYMINANQTASFNPDEMFIRSVQKSIAQDDNDEWR